mmetsp:Transcript_122850/g.309145  ORF Transcript_122850/g.309145 Transcript_122850/m.309145 type:complete len:319 (-) Transcript_122850:727-1683(-)
MDLRPLLPQRLRVLCPEGQDGLRAAGQDTHGGAPGNEAGPEADDAPSDRSLLSVDGEAGARACGAAHCTAEERAQVDHRVDEQVLHHEVHVRARHHAVRDPRRLDEGCAPHRALHVGPLTEVLQDVSDAGHHALQHQEDHTTRGVPVLLRVATGLPDHRLQCADQGHQEGAETNAAEGSGQGHHEALTECRALRDPVVPAAEDTAIGHVADVVSHLRTPDEDEHGHEVQPVLLCPAAVLDTVLIGDVCPCEGQAASNRPCQSDDGAQQRHRQHHGVLLHDAGHRLDDLDHEGDEVPVATEDAHQGQRPDGDEKEPYES